MLSIKVILFFSLVLAIACDSDSAPEEPAGGPITNLTGDDLEDAEKILNGSLTKLASGDGPSYKLGKIISATRQVVGGNKFVYEVELIEGDNTKKCTVEIWSQPWLENGIEVTFNCPDGKVVKKHSI